MQFSCKVNSLCKFTISLFLFIYSSNSIAQTWQHSISGDYEFGIKDKWAELGKYKAKFVVANERTAFVKEMLVFHDNWGKALFPEDFTHTRGDFYRDSLTEFNWYIEVKNKRVAGGKITYDSSPNTVLQLSKFDPKSIQNKIEIWGDVLDAYSWLDKNGLNLFIRSSLNREKGKYLYAYHYLENENEYKLLRKITDNIKSCDFEIVAEHAIESIELTDVNRDTIGEISFIYSLDCINNLKPETTKLMLLLEGKKYAIRGNSEICITDEEYIGGNYEIGKELINEPELRRFLEKKWKLYIHKEIESK